MENIKGPVRGAYQIKELTIMDFGQKNFVDLGNHVQSIIMKESLYQPYVTLKLVVEDSAALHEQMPMIGEEMIFFSWTDGPGVSTGNPARVFRKLFYVYKVSQLKDVKPTAQTYTIHAATPEYFQSKKTKVYGGWNQTPISRIATDVYEGWISQPLSKRFKGYEKELQVEETKGSLNFCCPGWTPHDTLEWLATKAISLERGSKGAFYFFWESMHGSYFKSIETILQKTNEFQETDMQQEVPQMHLVPAGVGNPGEDGPQNAYEQMIPDEYGFPQLFDSVSKLENGMIANRVVGLDYIHHAVLNYDYFYDKQGKQQGHAYARNLMNSSVSFLNPDPDADQRQGKFPKVQVKAISGSHDDAPVNALGGEGFSTMHRTSQLEQIRQLQMEAIVPYNAEYETGSLCYVFIPSKAGSMDTSLNGLTSGKYLITGMDHLLIGGLYKLKVRLVKESLLQNIDEALNLTTDEEENVSPFTGNPVAGGVAVKQEKRTSQSNPGLDPLDEDVYKQVTFHELDPPNVGPSS